MTEEAQRTNFANVLIRIFITQHSIKRLFRKPFIMYGRLLAVAAHVFQISGQLACRFRDHAQPFVTVFASSSDAATTVRVMSTEWGADVSSRITPGSSILDYVVNSEIDAFKFDGDRAAFYLKYLGAKVFREKVYEILHGFAMDGVALGLSDPDRFRELFEQSYSLLDEESMRKWNRARAAGVDIPEKPDVLDYAECEAEAVEMFSEYCREIYPDFAPSLGL